MKSTIEIKYFLLLILNFWLNLPHIQCQSYAMVQLPNTGFEHKGTFNNSNVDLDIPHTIGFYTHEQLEQQRIVNTQFAHEYVLSFTRIPDLLLFNESNYSLPIEDRVIDNEQITPFNWKWVSLEMDDPLGGKFMAHLRRPNWWLEKNGATEIGDLVYLNLPEMAIEGMAKITSFTQSYIDSRVPTFEAPLGNSYRPITGWFERTAGDIWNFVFSSGDTIGSTSSHLFFSEDKQEYSPIGRFAIGEKVKMKDNQTSILTGKYRREALTERVYNLEVWRDHNYFVGKNNILVHNNCIENLLKSFQINFEEVFSIQGKTWAKKVRKNDPALPKEINFTEDIVGPYYNEPVALAPAGTQGIDAFVENGKVLSYKIMEAQSIQANIDMTWSHFHGHTVKLEKYSSSNLSGQRYPSAECLLFEL